MIFMQIRLKVVRNCICIPFAECYKIALIVMTALLLLQRIKSDFEKQMHNAKQEGLGSLLLTYIYIQIYLHVIMLK